MNILTGYYVAKTGLMYGDNFVWYFVGPFQSPGEAFPFVAKMEALAANAEIKSTFPKRFEVVGFMGTHLPLGTKNDKVGFNPFRGTGVPPLLKDVLS